jgi:hypothetical protein
MLPNHQFICCFDIEGNCCHCPVPIFTRSSRRVDGCVWERSHPLFMGVYSRADRDHIYYGGAVSQLEAIGARNFIDLDDIPVLKEGELIDPLSIVTLPTINQRPGRSLNAHRMTLSCDSWARPKRNGHHCLMVRGSRIG